MKIIQLTAFFLPVTGGMEQHVLNLCKHLQKKGHEVEVFCSDSSREETIDKKNEVLEGIKITRFKTLLNITKLTKIFPGFIFPLLKKDYDILHVHSYRQPYTIMALLAAKLRGKKCILTTHCPLHQKETRTKLTYSFAVCYDFLLGKFTGKFNHIIGIANEEIPFFTKRGILRNKISIIPNGITSAEFKKGDKNKFLKKYKIKKNSFIALFTGRIHKTKGLQNLKHAVDNLKEVTFVFVGPDDGELKNLKELFKDNKNVIFTGRVEHEEIIDAYSVADIFILPSEYEPFGISLLEAMAQELPILSTNQGGPRDFIKKDFGFLINPKNQKEWTSKIKFFIDKPSLKKEMGIKSKEFAKNYLWENIVDQIISVYKKD